jgi:hypothetical protein
VMRGGTLPDPVDQGELTPRAIRGGVMWLIGHGLVPATVFAWDATGLGRIAQRVADSIGRCPKRVSRPLST